MIRRWKNNEYTLKSGETVQVAGVQMEEANQRVNLTLRNRSENPAWAGPLYLTTHELELNRAQ